MDTKDPYGDPDNVNPKDLQGIKKVPLHFVPAASTYYEAMAFMEGASKYDPFNWREKPVKATVYVAAALRHLMAWYNRQEVAREGPPHLGNAKASIGILIDAYEMGNLIDDRPPAGVDLDELGDKFSPLIAKFMQDWAERLQREHGPKITAE